MFGYIFCGAALMTSIFWSVSGGTDKQQAAAEMFRWPGTCPFTFLKLSFGYIFMVCYLNFVRCASLLEDEALADAAPVLNPG